jgi:hypothetical protein
MFLVRKPFMKSKSYVRTERIISKTILGKILCCLSKLVKTNSFLFRFSWSTILSLATQLDKVTLYDLMYLSS